MAVELAGKAALVTGGGRGICLAFVEKLISAGCKVAIVDLALDPSAEQLIKNNEASAFFQKADVTNWHELQAAFDAAFQRFGRLDVVCPGAGIFEPPKTKFWEFRSSSDTLDDSHYKVLEINLTHPIRCTQLAIDFFLRQKLGHGVVVHTTSIAAQIVAAPIPLYVTSKAGLSHFIRSMGVLEEACAIRVNGVAPGNVKTTLWNDAGRTEWLDAQQDEWISPSRIADVMIDLVTKPEYVGGSIWEVSLHDVRKVELFHDAGPDFSKPGLSVSNLHLAQEDLAGLLRENFGS